jgi:hypothetical protein
VNKLLQTIGSPDKSYFYRTSASRKTKTKLTKKFASSKLNFATLPLSNINKTKKDDVFLLIYDCSDLRSFENIKNCCNILKELHENIHGVLIGTNFESCLSNRREVPRKESQEFAKSENLKNIEIISHFIPDAFLVVKTLTENSHLSKLKKLKEKKKN